MRRLLGLFVALLLFTVAAAAFAALGGRVYRNASWRIAQLELPRGWELVPSGQIGFPRVLLVADNQGARLTVGVERVTPGTGAVDVATTARAALARQGFADLRVTPLEGDRARLEATLEGGRRVLRQIYVVDADTAYVLAVVAQAERKERMQRELEECARSLALSPPDVDAAAPPLVDAGRPSG